LYHGWALLDHTGALDNIGEQRDECRFAGRLVGRRSSVVDS
jgi:hypothetical protein